MKPIPSLSFEFFPPKTQQGMENLLQTAQQLATWQPDFFSVTYGAGGSTRDTTLNTVTTLQKTTPIAVAPHLSCIGSDREEIQHMLAQYKSHGMRRIIALRGDLPSGMGQPGEFKYASELVALIRETTGNFFHISVAAYPEIHPQAKCAFNDIKNLKNKFAAGADSAITQYFFNADAYFYYRDACAKQGIQQPIIPGIMPILHFKKLQRFSETCGAEIPLWLCKRFEAYGDDVESVKQLGVEVVHHLCERLIAGGVPGLHFYTLNHAEICLEILRLLRVDSTANRSSNQKASSGRTT